MVSFWKVLSVAAASVQSVRIKRKQKEVSFGGVPVLNFDKAFQGRSSLAEQSTEQQNWILVTQDGTTDKQIAALCSQAKCMKQGHPDKGGVSFFEIRGTVGDLKTLLEHSDGAVKFAEPDGFFELEPEIEAAQTAETWGLNRIGAPSREWEGEGVTVFVLDTGIRNSHVDFTGRVVPFLDMTLGEEGQESCNGDLSCALDIRGHGTHCAGSAAGETFGVAPKAEVGAIKVLSNAGRGEWGWSYTALDFLATSPIRPAVASMSLGGEGRLAAMKVSVDAAVSAGVTVVVAGGNENSPACEFSPAYIGSAITVGSTTSNDERSYFSNFGTCNNIWAPGSDIRSASMRTDDGESVKSGTSMACPHVSGAAALLLSEDRSRSSSEVLDVLLDRSTKGALKYMRSGDVNKLLWVGAGDPPPTPAPAPTPIPEPSVCDKFGSSDLNFYGLCSCDYGFICSQPGVGAEDGCEFRPARFSLKYFNYSCTDCGCVAKPVEPITPES